MSYYVDRFHVLSEKKSQHTRHLFPHTFTVTVWHTPSKIVRLLIINIFIFLTVVLINTKIISSDHQSILYWPITTEASKLLIQNNSELLLHFERPPYIPFFDNLLKLVTTILDLWCLQWCLSINHKILLAFLGFLWDLDVKLYFWQTA